MGEAKRRQAVQAGPAPAVAVSPSVQVPAAAEVVSEGGRERINLSLSPEVRGLVRAYAKALGMTESQLALHAILLALPQLQSEVAAVQRVTGGGDQ